MGLLDEFFTAPAGGAGGGSREEVIEKTHGASSI